MVRDSSRRSFHEQNDPVSVWVQLSLTQKLFLDVAAKHDVGRAGVEEVRPQTARAVRTKNHRRLDDAADDSIVQTKDWQ